MSKTDSFFTPKYLYSQELLSISDVNLTFHEVDIIACLLSGRTTKTIASFLEIEERTVEAHKYNIMKKLRCSSKDTIREFIEKSDKFFIIQAHYVNLLTHFIFWKSLLKIKSLIENKVSVCLIDYKNNSKTRKDLYLKEYLRLSGIKVIENKKEDYRSFMSENKRDTVNFILNIFYKDCSDSPRLADIIEVSKKKYSDFQGKLIFIFFKKNPLQKNFQDNEKISYINFYDEKSYYFFIFKILEKITPFLNFNCIIDDFKKSLKGIQGSFEKKFAVENQVQTKTPLIKKKIFKNLLIKNINYSGNLNSIFLGGILSIGGYFFFNKYSILENKDYFSNSKNLYFTRGELPLPVKNNFLERTDLISEIEKKFSALKGNIYTVALIGIGGAGKTTLARQYARQQKVRAVWEINAETKESIINSLENLAQILCIDDNDRKELKLLQETAPHKKEILLIFFVKTRLKNFSPWLLIYDNVLNIEDIHKYFPYDVKVWGEGKVIITTRDENIKNNIYVNSFISVGELSPNEKLILFKKIIGTYKLHSSKENISFSIQKFLAYLPPFPLDVSAAAHYLKSTHISYKDYLKRLNLQTQGFVNLQEVILNSQDYKNTRYNIITLSLTKIIESKNPFSLLLLFICLIDSQNIPRELLEQSLAHEIIDGFIYNLKKYSLITNENESSDLRSSFSIHRSTQYICLNFLKNFLKLDKKNSYFQIIFESLKKYIDTAIEKEDFPKMKSLIPHILKFLSHNDLLEKDILGYLEREIGLIYFYLADYPKATQFLEMSQTKLKKYFHNDISIAQNLIYLGISYRELGNYGKAKELLEKSLSIYKADPLKNYEHIAWIFIHLGNVYREYGDYAKAKEVLEKSISIYKKNNFHKSESKIAWALVYLGDVYRSLGDYKLASKLYEESLTLNIKVYGPNHIRTAWTSVYLANAYENLGNYREAETLLRQSLNTFKKEMSESHESFGWALVYLGNIYFQVGDYAKARILLEKSRQIHEKHYGKTHIKTAWVLMYLAKAETALVNYADAISHFEKSLEIHKKHFGENHPKIGLILSNLGKVFIKQGAYDKAKDFFSKSLKIFQAHHNRNQLEIAKIFINLGQIDYYGNDLDKAEKKYYKAMEIFQKNKPVETYISLENLADIQLTRSLIETKKENKKLAQYFLKKARQYLSQALMILEIYFPEDSPHLLRIKTKIKKIEKNI